MRRDDDCAFLPVTRPAGLLQIVFPRNESVGPERERQGIVVSGKLKAVSGERRTELHLSLTAYNLPLTRYPPTWTLGRRSGSSSACLKISRVTGAVSPSPKRMYRAR